MCVHVAMCTLNSGFTHQLFFRFVKGAGSISLHDSVIYAGSMNYLLSSGIMQHCWEQNIIILVNQLATCITSHQMQAK